MLTVLVKMSDPLRKSEIEHLIEEPSSEVGLYEDMSDDGSDESILLGESVDDTDNDPNYEPSSGSEYEVAGNDSAMDVDIPEESDSGGNVSDLTLNTPPSDRDTGDWHTFVGKQQSFQYNLTPKFKFHVPNDAQPIDFFEHYLTEDVIDLMVVETNRNANYVISKRRLSRKSRLKDWKNTNPEEMRKFIGVLLYMGLVPLPRISDYWSKDVLYKFTAASKVMSRNRFQLILRFWHFNDNNNLAKDGRIGKIKPLLTKLNTLFFYLKETEKDLVIDETMIPFRGRLSFRQYIPGKAHKYGIKIFKLCDKTGYTYAVKMYMGKGTVESNDNSVATSVVMELMSKSLNQGHTLFVDNYYTSVELANLLLSKQTHLTGTLRVNRKGVPKKELKEKLEKGDMLCLENNNGIVVTKWNDRREVHMLSTLHPPDFVEIPSKYPGKNSTLKPLVVAEYNKAKVGIDLSDQMSSYSTAVRKTIRWYHKLGEELLLGTSVVNSWLAYNSFLKSKTTPNTSKKKHLISITTFKELLSLKLMCLEQEPRIPEVTVTGHHYLTASPFVGNGPRKRRARKVCKLCYKKVAEEKGRQVARNMTQVATYCSECPDKPFLCETCFKHIHK